MPRFDFQTINADGRRARGHETAPSVPALVSALEARGFTVLHVHERPVDAAPARRASGSAVADAVRALASLSAAGLPLARVLEVAASTAPPALRAPLRDVCARVERGESLAASLAAHPHLFRPAAIGVIRAGERAGDLDGALERLATQLERAEALRARLLSAAVYPSVLAVAGGAAMMVLMLFVLPRFASLFAETGLALPRSTALLLAAAAALRRNWAVLPLATATVAAVACWIWLSAPGRRTWSRVLLAVPVVRGARLDALNAAVARTLGVLLRGGAPIAAALEDAAASLDDAGARDALRRVRVRVVAGSSLQAAMEAEAVLASALCTLVATGEQAGRLAEFVERAAELFEQRTERATQRAVALLEPAMIVLFGGVVGVIALALLQGIYGINPTGLVR